MGNDNKFAVQCKDRVKQARGGAVGEEVSIGNYSCRQAARQEGRKEGGREGGQEGRGFAVKSIEQAYLSSTAHSLVAAKGNYTT